ncbi:MAG: hypothetical protein ACK502_05790 [Alphaproteobacteria bacterium]
MKNIAFTFTAIVAFGIYGSASAQVSDEGYTITRRSCINIINASFTPPDKCFCKLEVLEIDLMEHRTTKFPSSTIPASSEEDCKKKCQAACDAINAANKPNPEGRKKKKKPAPVKPVPVDDAGICDLSPLSPVC